MSFFPYFVCALLGVDSLRGGLAEGNRIFANKFAELIGSLFASTSHHSTKKLFSRPEYRTMTFAVTLQCEWFNGQQTCRGGEGGDGPSPHLGSFSTSLRLGPPYQCLGTRSLNVTRRIGCTEAGHKDFAVNR